MPSTTIDDLRDPRGRFSMLAIDQRGSLRTMLAQGADPDGVSDEQLVAFKVDVARSLSGHASAMLVDRDYGHEAALAATCPVILAADVLSSSVPGGPVDSAELDLEVTADLAREYRAAALKQLVPWTPGTRDAAVDLSARFMELCRAAGLPGIVEGVVRPADIADWSDADRDEAIVTAARDLGGVAPDLYKGEVPSYGRGDLAGITAVAARVTAVLDCPWVVLSSGVTADDFPAAVQACQAGGADGFLAGRAIWADAVTAADPAEFLRTVSAARLRRMAAG
jgi:sulfofructosephosphate aldolase